MSSFKNADYIDLMEFAKTLWVYKFFIIAMAFVVGMLFTVQVEFFTDDVYVSYGTLYLSNKSLEQTDDPVGQADIILANSMMATYKEILQTRAFMEQISADLDGKFSWGAVKGMTTIKEVSGTQLLTVQVSANNPADAFLVAKTITDRAPEKLGSVFNNGLVYVVDDPAVPAAPLSKGTTRKTLMGFAMGGFIAAMIIIVLKFFDKTIHKSDDVAKRYNVSILGEITH